MRQVIVTTMQPSVTCANLLAGCVATPQTWPIIIISNRPISAGENTDELLIACAKHLHAYDSAHLHLLRANQVHKPLLLAKKAPGDVFHPWRQRGTEQQRLHVL